MRKGEVFFLVRFRQDLVSAVMKTLAVRGHDEQLGNALSNPGNWHQSISDALPGDAGSRARLRALGARVRAPAFRLDLTRICSRRGSDGAIQWSLRAREEKPKGLLALTELLRVGIQAEGFGPQAGHTAHVTLSYRAPVELVEAVRIVPIVLPVDEFELAECRDRPYRYETIERWPLLPGTDPAHEQPGLFAL